MHPQSGVPPRSRGLEHRGLPGDLGDLRGLQGGQVGLVGVPASSGGSRALRGQADYLGRLPGAGRERGLSASKIARPKSTFCYEQN